MRMQINGEIVMSDDKWVYDWFGLESTAPSDIRTALNGLEDGEELTLEFVSVFEVDGQEYRAFFPAEEEEAEE